MCLLNLAVRFDMGSLDTYYDTPAKVKSIKLLQTLKQQPYTGESANFSSKKPIYEQQQPLQQAGWAIRERRATKSKQAEKKMGLCQS